MSDRLGTVVRRLAMACLVAGLGSAGSALATLLDRGPDLVYDDVLNLTWTRNANLPGNFDLTWDEASTWAANLLYAGFSDWRLPWGSVSAGAGPAVAFACDVVPEETCRDNEMGYMFYHNLGGLLGSDKTGDQTANGGELLTGIQPVYWSGTKVDPSTAGGFRFTDGNVLDIPDINIGIGTWAVHPGDVAVVPEPSSVLLIGVGMFGLAWARRADTCHRQLEVATSERGAIKTQSKCRITTRCRGRAEQQPRALPAWSPRAPERERYAASRSK